MVAYTLEGKERWRRPMGPFQNFYGMAASPLVAGDLVVLNCDQLTGGFLLAVDRKIVGYCSFHAGNGRVSYPWCLKGYEGHAEKQWRDQDQQQ